MSHIFYVNHLSISRLQLGWPVWFGDSIWGKNMNHYFHIQYSLLWVLKPRTPSHWRINDHDGISNHQPHGCLLNRLFRHRSKKISKLRVTGLCVGNSPGPVNSPQKGPVTWKMFPFDDVIIVRRAGLLCCPACRTTLVATRFRVAVICPIIQVPHCIRVFFYFVWFVFINHIFQFYNELCTYCNILDITGVCLLLPWLIKWK